ncbi:MAG: hypothetical protein ACRYFX_10540 [Janthinobacterium lividum]
MTNLISPKILLACPLLFCLVNNAWGQSVAPIPIDKITEKITYIGKVLSPGKSQGDLLRYAQAWAAGVAAEKPAVAATKLSGNTLTVTATRLLAYICAGKSVTYPLYYTAKVRTHAGYFNYEVTDLQLLLPNNPIQAAEPYILYSSSQNQESAQCISNARQAFTEIMASIITEMQTIILNKSNVNQKKAAK